MQLQCIFNKQCTYIVLQIKFSNTPAKVIAYYIYTINNHQTEMMCQILTVRNSLTSATLLVDIFP